MQVSVPRYSPPKDPDKETTRAKRGNISRYSSASQRRFLRSMASTIRGASASMAVLTYPSLWDMDPKAWKAHLKALTKRLARRYPDICGFWKLEFQLRGAPHFHLVAFGLPEENTPEHASFLQWLSNAWYEVVGSGDPLHLQHGVYLDKVYSEKGMIVYTAAYVGKPETLEVGGVGRWWGTFNTKKIPWAEVAEAHGIEPRAAFALMRAMRRHASPGIVQRRDSKGNLIPGKFRRKRVKAMGHGRFGLTILCDASFWGRKLKQFIEAIENEPF